MPFNTRLFYLEYNSTGKKVLPAKLTETNMAGSWVQKNTLILLGPLSGEEITLLLIVNW